MNDQYSPPPTPFHPPAVQHGFPGFSIDDCLALVLAPAQFSVIQNNVGNIKDVRVCTLCDMNLEEMFSGVFKLLVIHTSQ